LGAGQKELHPHPHPITSPILIHTLAPGSVLELLLLLFIELAGERVLRFNMLHIISRHRYPLALSILLTCASFSICCQRVDGLFGNKDIDNDMDMGSNSNTAVCAHVYQRTCISRASANCSRVLPPRTLILVDAVVLATSCTQLEAINFRPDKEENMRQGGECLDQGRRTTKKRKTRKMWKTIMSQKFPTL